MAGEAAKAEGVEAEEGVEAGPGGLPPSAHLLKVQAAPERNRLGMVDNIGELVSLADSLVGTREVERAQLEALCDSWISREWASRRWSVMGGLATGDASLGGWGEPTAE